MSSTERHTAHGVQRFITVLPVALLLALATHLQPGTHLEPGLDQSWAYGINYMFKHGLVAGRDIVFTFGPFGFLEHTRVLSPDMVYASTAFWLCISTLQILVSFWLAFPSDGNRWLSLSSALLVIALTVLLFPQIQRLLVLGYLLALLHWRERKNFLLCLLSASCAAGLLIKFTYGAAQLSFLALYVLTATACGRLSWRAWHFAFVPALLVLLGCYWLLYRDPAAILGYIEGGLQFSRGSQSAMALNPANNWWAIGAFYTACLAAVVVMHRSNHGEYRWLPLAFAGPLFIWSKYAFGLEEAPHLFPLLDLIFFAALTWMIAIRSLKARVALLAILLAAMLAWHSMHTVETGAPDYVNLPQSTLLTKTRAQEALQLPTQIAVWRDAERERLSPLQLPPAVRGKIGDASVDVYPWEATIAAANALRWHPRPVFQNYVTYTPFLDQKNADYFSSDKAPAFIVWHHHSFPDILQRMPLSTDPLTVEAIFRHYRRVLCEQSFCVWQQSATPLLGNAATLATQDANWDNWLPVPATPSHSILRASINATRTPAGLLNLWLWKEGGLQVDYRLANGAVKTHDLLIDNAISGIWIAPYFEKGLLPTSDTQPASAGIDRNDITPWLSTPLAEGFVERVEDSGFHWQVTGWAARRDCPADRQHRAVLFYSATQAFLFPAVAHYRPDVASYLSGQGIAQPGATGIQHELPARQLPPGDFKVTLAVSCDTHWSVITSPAMTATIQDIPAGNRVTAIRLRTTRPWAFVPSAQLSWQQLDFTGQPPW